VTKVNSSLDIISCFHHITIFTEESRGTKSKSRKCHNWLIEASHNLSLFLSRTSPSFFPAGSSDLNRGLIFLQIYEYSRIDLVFQIGPQQSKSKCSRSPTPRAASFQGSHGHPKFATISTDPPLLWRSRWRPSPIHSLPCR
jgi:hypothetical protein